MHIPGSALEGGAVFEGEGQAAIRIGCGVVQQAAPELLAEGGDLAVLLLQNAEEVLHRSAPVEDFADLLCDCFLLGLGLFELLAEGIEVLVVLGLVLRHRGVLPDHLLDHAVQDFHLRKELLLLGLQLGSVEGLGHAQLVGSNGGVPSGQQMVDRHREALLHRGLIEVRRGAADAWMRCVAMRMKSDYSYSLSIVYNTFPWPSPTEEQIKAIEKTAQEILDARDSYPDSSLADLYDKTGFSAATRLKKAHIANDRAVMRAYGFSIKDMSEEDCVVELMKMYQQLVNQQTK